MARWERSKESRESGESKESNLPNPSTHSIHSKRVPIKCGTRRKSTREACLAALASWRFSLLFRGRGQDEDDASASRSQFCDDII